MERAVGDDQRVSHFTETMPYQPGTTRRSGKPWACGQRPAIHGVGEQDLGRRALSSGEAARERIGPGEVGLRDRARVGAFEDHFEGARSYAGAGEDVRQGDAGPLGIADRAELPPRPSTFGEEEDRPLPAHSRGAVTVRVFMPIRSAS